MLLYLFSPKETVEGFLNFSRRSGAPLVRFPIFPLPIGFGRDVTSLLAVAIGNMTPLTRKTLWEFWLLKAPPRIYVSVRFIFCIIFMGSLGISDSILSTCLSKARIYLSAEDNVIALALAECPPSPSSSRSALSAALRPSSPSSMRVSPLGPSAAKPTKGELLVQLETPSRKPWSVKRKTLGFAEKDRPALAKVSKLGASSSHSSTPVRKPGLALYPPAEVPKVLSSHPRSGSAAKAKSPSGKAVEQPLAIMPITVWNPPAKSVRPLSSKTEELKRKDSETSGDGDSLLLDVELADGAVSSILKDFDLKRSSALPVDEALALSLQGVASVSSHILSYLISF